MGTGSFPGVKRPGRGAYHPPPPSAAVKREYSYTSTPLWAFGSVTGQLYLCDPEIHETSKRKSNWIGHILRRNCLLQQVIEEKIKGKVEVTGRRERRRRMKLMEDLKERRG
jgi:hypothetical protein